MSPEERAALAKTADAATPGPWTACRTCHSPGRADPSGRPCGLVWSEPLDAPVLCAGASPDLATEWKQPQHTVNDALFIAAAREAIPALLAYIDELEKRKT